MGKNKLRKFADMAALERVFQYPWAELQQAGGVCPLRGRWGAEVFGNDLPIVLELGCGKGEYTVGLARRFPQCNYIGIDIKGARMWTGAMAAEREGLTNVAFLRTSIELLPAFFAPGEVSEIWVTFPDPQMQKPSKRLTGTRFLGLYRQVASPGAVVSLKTDSPFLYAYTTLMLSHNGIAPLAASADIDADAGLPEHLTQICTYYEQQWRGRGIPIKYVSFAIPDAAATLTEPEHDIPKDDYRSFHRDAAAEVSR